MDAWSSSKDKSVYILNETRPGTHNEAYIWHKPLILSYICTHIPALLLFYDSKEPYKYTEH